MRKTSTSDFLPLTEGEKATALAAMKRSRWAAAATEQYLKGKRVAYVQQDNYTVAIMRSGKFLYVGVAKRNPKDRLSEKIGANIALSRAIRSDGGIEL